MSPIKGNLDGHREMTGSCAHEFLKLSQEFFPVFVVIIAPIEAVSPDIVGHALAQVAFSVTMALCVVAPLEAAFDIFMATFAMRQIAIIGITAIITPVSLEIAHNYVPFVEIRCKFGVDPTQRQHPYRRNVAAKPAQTVDRVGKRDWSRRIPSSIPPHLPLCRNPTTLSPLTHTRVVTL